LVVGIGETGGRRHAGKFYICNILAEPACGTSLEAETRLNWAQQLGQTSQNKAEY
jgi:hypothetical protein